MSSEYFAPTVTIRRWRGLMTTLESKEIPLGKAAICQGCDLRSGVALASERGYAKYGNLNQTSGKITSGFDYEKRDGTVINFVLWDSGSTATLYFLHPDDTTNDSNGEWEQLLTGLTTGYLIGGVGFNTVSVDNVIFGNAIAASRTWNGAYTRLTVAATSGDATITVASTTGFDASGSLVVTGDNGTLATVTYTGKTATTFTGCSGMPTTRVNRGVAQATAAISAAPWSNKWISVDGRVECIGVSGSDGSNSIRLFGSAVGDHTDWTASTTPDSAFFRDFPDIGGSALGLASLRGSSGDFTTWIFGAKGVASYALEFPTSTTRVAKSKTFRDKSGVAGVAHYAIANVLNDIWFATPDNSVLSLYSPEFKDGFDTDQIFEDIRGTVTDYDMTKGRAAFFDKEKRFLLACRTSTSVTDNDVVVDVQLVKDQETGQYTKEVNLLNWAVGCWLKRSGKLLFGSSVEPKVYRAFSGFQSGQAGSPIDFKYTTKRLSEVVLAGPKYLGTFNEKQCRYIALTGLIAPGSILNVKLYCDAGGSRGTLEGTIDGTEDTSLVQMVNALGELGMFPLGQEVLGGLTESLSDLNPFIAFLTVPEEYTAFDYQVELSGSGQGYRVKIEELCLLIADPGHVVPEARKKELA